MATKKNIIDTHDSPERAKEGRIMDAKQKMNFEHFNSVTGIRYDVIQDLTNELCVGISEREVSNFKVEKHRTGAITVTAYFYDDRWLHWLRSKDGEALFKTAWKNLQIEK